MAQISVCFILKKPDYFLCFLLNDWPLKLPISLLPSYLTEATTPAVVYGKPAAHTSTQMCSADVRLCLWNAACVDLKITKHYCVCVWAFLNSFLMFQHLFLIASESLFFIKLLRYFFLMFCQICIMCECFKPLVATFTQAKKNVYSQSNANIICKADISRLHHLGYFQIHVALITYLFKACISLYHLIPKHEHQFNLCVSLRLDFMRNDYVVGFSYAWCNVCMFITAQITQSSRRCTEIKEELKGVLG